ncbi:hypothetical protein Y032_0541g3206 [Ancylostoma ceylanicum]|uniref:Uncharacterized protein n=1 Tax=Ancylostoma ceylanicum TaxID=53326 RepID=A0A016WT32_9BILA|nr:hypothetical protein Y032_0541g3206 [Ancylostoma ceylanicum]
MFTVLAICSPFQKQRQLSLCVYYLYFSPASPNTCSYVVFHLTLTSSRLCRQVKLYKQKRSNSRLHLMQTPPEPN